MTSYNDGTLLLIVLTFNINIIIIFLYSTLIDILLSN